MNEDKRNETFGESDSQVEDRMHRISRRSFLWAGVAFASTYTGWRWLISRRTDNGIVWPFRRVLETNEELARDYYRTYRLAPTFPVSMAGEPNTDGKDLGLQGHFDPHTWHLRVERMEGDTDPLALTLADIKRLPRVEMVTEHKCIEGWSQIVHWAGARFADFMKRYPPATHSGDPMDILHRPDDLPNYVYMETPDGEYYVGLEIESVLHPQTLLCYEMNGQPLSAIHGAPLRLVIPIKYGIKNIKRIGTIRYRFQRPTDYWFEQGYDWYAGF